MRLAHRVADVEAFDARRSGASSSRGPPAAPRCAPPACACARERAGRARARRCAAPCSSQRATRPRAARSTCTGLPACSARIASSPSGASQLVARRSSRGESLPRVVLRQGRLRARSRGVAARGVVREEAAVAKMAPAAHHREGHARRSRRGVRPTMSASVSEPVLRPTAGAVRAQRGSGRGDRRLLVAQRLGGGVHLLASPRPRLSVPSQEVRGLVDVAVVLLRRDQVRRTGAEQRSIWCSRHGRERWANTVSSQVRSRKTLLQVADGLADRPGARDRARRSDCPWSCAPR